VPLYEFACTPCGPFEVVRPMAEATSPARCPACGGEARRIFTPPGLALLARPVRRALDTEEKSAHEPSVVSRKSGRPLPHLHGHGHAAPMPWVMSH
jgi:putative FmdB family regulatory protein